MKTLAERLRYAMEVLPPKKIKGVELARAVGVRPPSVSDWLSGKSKTMEGENLLKAAKFLSVNANWLATGNGTATDKNTKNNDEEIANILFKNLNINKVPLLDYKQITHWFENKNEKIKLYTYTDYLGADPENIFSLIVQGDSMSPDFKDGDLLIVDSSINPKPGTYVIAQCNLDEVTFKKYRVLYQNECGEDIFELVSMNKDYPSLTSLDNRIRVIGVVVRFIRNLNF